jgi:hypothetical protein
MTPLFYDSQWELRALETKAKNCKTTLLFSYFSSSLIVQFDLDISLSQGQRYTGYNAVMVPADLARRDDKIRRTPLKLSIARIKRTPCQSHHEHIFNKGKCNPGCHAIVNLCGT